MVDGSGWSCDTLKCLSYCSAREYWIGSYYHTSWVLGCRTLASRVSIQPGSNLRCDVFCSSAASAILVFVVALFLW